MEIFRQLVTMYRDVFVQNGWLCGSISLSYIHLHKSKVILSSFHNFQKQTFLSIPNLKIKKDEDILDILVCILELFFCKKLDFQNEENGQNPIQALTNIQKKVAAIESYISSRVEESRGASGEEVDPFILDSFIPFVNRILQNQNRVARNLWDSEIFISLAPQFNVLKPIWISTADEIQNPLKYLVVSDDSLLPSTIKMPRVLQSDNLTLEFTHVLYQNLDSLVIPELKKAILYVNYSEYPSFTQHVLEYFDTLPDSDGEPSCWDFLPPEGRYFISELKWAVYSQFVDNFYYLRPGYQISPRPFEEYFIKQVRSAIDRFDLLKQELKKQEALKQTDLDSCLHKWFAYLSQQTVMKKLLLQLLKHRTDVWDPVENVLILCIEYNRRDPYESIGNSASFFVIKPTEDKAGKVVKVLREYNKDLDQSYWEGYLHLRRGGTTAPTETT